MNPEILAQFQHISIGPLTLYGYGIIIGIAIIAGITVFWKIAPSTIKDRPEFLTVLTSALIAGVVGGRLLYVMSHISEFSSLWGAVRLWDGGSTIFGVLLGGLAGLIIGARITRTKIPLLSILDYAAPGVALGQAIGRWGNFINQELYGLPTDVPWKMYISPEHRISGYEQDEFFHPTFLYESILSLILAGSLFFLIHNMELAKKKRGLAAGIYLISYGIIRICMERVRIDSEPLVAFLKPADVMSFALIIIGVILVCHERITPRHSR